MPSSIYCPVCGDLQDCVQVFVRNDIPILRCSACSVGMTQLPNNFSAASIYTEAYFQGGHADGYSDYVGSEDVLRGEFRTAVQDLRSAGCTDGTLLELGCAYGFFLAEANAYFKVQGSK